MKSPSFVCLFISFRLSTLDAKNITMYIRAHRTSLLHSQIDCAASVGQCKTLSDLKSRCYICKEHPH